VIIRRKQQTRGLVPQQAGYEIGAKPNEREKDIGEECARNTPKIPDSCSGTAGRPTGISGVVGYQREEQEQTDRTHGDKQPIAKPASMAGQR